MKFKKNAIYIEVLVLEESVIILSLLFLLCSGIAIGPDGIIWHNILFILVLMALAPLPFIIFFRGLFYDTVYYDEKSIRIVTRKKTWEYTWDEVLRIERIIGGRSGTLGWRLVALTGEKHEMYPFSARFIEFVKKNTPYLEIRMMP